MKIRLIDAGRKKIAVIKAIRAATGLNLKDAKQLCDRAPVTFEAKVDPSQSRHIVREFKEAGARIDATLTATAIDKLTANSYISTAQVALGEGNLTETKNCLRAALRLLGDFLDDIDYVGVEDES